METNQTMLSDSKGNDLVDRLKGLTGPNQQPNHKYEPVSKEHKKEDSNKLCEAFSCNNSATEEAIIRVGKFGNIRLSLCNQCISNFRQ